jgi:hypothetical protein
VADVALESGQRVRNVALSDLQRRSCSSTSTSTNGCLTAEQAKRRLLAVGVGVRVAHLGTKVASRQGTVQRCRTDGTYDVVVNELGEQALLRRVPLASLVVVVVGKPVVFEEGMRVTVKRSHVYLRGEVERCRRDGTYDVRVREEEEEARGGGAALTTLRSVAWELLALDDHDDNEEEEEIRSPRKSQKEEITSHRRAQKEGITSHRRAQEEEGKHEDEGEELQQGDRVEARFQGQAMYYSGRITRVHRDNACDITYDDGDVELHVVRHWIRRKTPPATGTRAGTTTITTTTTYDDDEFEVDD